MITRLKHTDRKNSIKVLDGMRAIACLSVISYHIHYFMSAHYNLSAILGRYTSSIAMAGWSGVTLFFVLSGFLLFLPYAKALLFEGDWPSIRAFYLKRVLRILPGYYISLLLLILFSHPEYLHPKRISELSLFVTFLMDSSPLTYQKINGPFWTLAIEWQFYMFLPLLAYGFRWIVKRGRSPQTRLWLLTGCLLGMILWGLGTRYVGRYYTLHPDETFLVPRHILDIILLCTYGTTGKFLEDFAVGMLICSCYILTQANIYENKLRQYITSSSLWLWGAGILLLFFMAVWNTFPELGFLEPLIGAHNWLCELGFASGFGLCMIAILFGPIGLQRLFEWNLLYGIGSLSYSLYIWHLPILLFVRDAVINQSLQSSFKFIYSQYWLSVLLLIIPFSYLFYRWIEYPGICYAKRIRTKGRSSSPN